MMTAFIWPHFAWQPKYESYKCCQHLNYSICKYIIIVLIGLFWRRTSLILNHMSSFRAMIEIQLFKSEQQLEINSKSWKNDINILLFFIWIWSYTVWLVACSWKRSTYPHFSLSQFILFLIITHSEKRNR